MPGGGSGGTADWFEKYIELMNKRLEEALATNALQQKVINENRDKIETHKIEIENIKENLQNLKLNTKNDVKKNKSDNNTTLMQKIKNYKELILAGGVVIYTIIEQILKLLGGN